MRKHWSRVKNSLASLCHIQGNKLMERFSFLPPSHPPKWWVISQPYSRPHPLQSAQCIFSGQCWPIRAMIRSRLFCHLWMFRSRQLSSRAAVRFTLDSCIWVTLDSCIWFTLNSCYVRNCIIYPRQLSVWAAVSPTLDSCQFGQQFDLP